MRAHRDVDLVLVLLANGLSPLEIARRTGIPRSTVRDWASGRTPQYARTSNCPRCHQTSMNGAAYSYLFGMYLGDGCLSEHRRGVYRLRITLDAIYPNIVEECRTAIEDIAPRKRAYLLRRRHSRAVELSSYWKHWLCLFPQHGKGRKHMRHIALAEWQRRLVYPHVEPFIRGLIQSDGTRIVATERKGRSVRRAPRYAFKNRSKDILALFQDACEAAGVHCTRSSETQISVYSKAAVARLDEFVGPKS